MSISPLGSSGAAQINALFAGSASRLQSAAPPVGGEQAEFSVQAIEGYSGQRNSRPQDSVELSPAAQRRSGQSTDQSGKTGQQDSVSEELGPDGEPLTSEESEQLRELRARDVEVKTHEQAHVAAAGSLFKGGPYYSYQQGPDGKRYAVGGSVQIDTSSGRTPEETIQRAAQIKRSALAPAEPSSTDRAVAAKADRMAADAKQELAEQQLEGESTKPATQSGREDDLNPKQGVNDAGTSRISEALSAYASSQQGSQQAASIGSLDTVG